MEEQTSKSNGMLDILSGQLAGISPLIFKEVLSNDGNWEPVLIVAMGGILASFAYDILTTFIEVVLFKFVIPQGINRLLALFSAGAAGYLISTMLLQESGVSTGFTALLTAYFAMTFYKSGGKELWETFGLDSTKLIEANQPQEIA